MRRLLGILAMFVLTLMMISVVSAATVNESREERWDLVEGLVIEEIEVNGEEVDASLLGGGEVLAVEEGEPLEVEVKLAALADFDDVQVRVEIDGYEYSDFEDLSDRTHTFDMTEGTTKVVRGLEVALPHELDKNVYWLRVRVVNRNGVSLERVVELHVEPQRHALEVADVFVSPSTTVKAGRSLLVTTLLENFGDRDLRDVLVRADLVGPEGVVASAFESVDRVDTNRETDRNNFDFEDVPEMFLPVPATAEGQYQVVVTAEYDDRRETARKTVPITVTANELFQEPEQKLVLAVGPETQTVAAGKMATYAVALTNAGARSKAYTVSATTGSWGTARVTESLVVLEPGKNKVVYVEVTPAADAAEGQYTTSVEIKSGDDVLETVTFTSNVVAQPAEEFSLRNGLEIALIVLVVLLVIIGLIVGFSRLRKGDEEEEQTYY